MASEVAGALATVSGGVGKVEYPPDVPIDGKVDVASVVSSPYPNESLTLESKVHPNVRGALAWPQRRHSLGACPRKAYVCPPFAVFWV